MNKIWQWIKRLFLSKDAKMLAAIDASMEAYARYERTMSRQAYRAMDIQTKRRVQLDKISARLARVGDLHPLCAKWRSAYILLEDIIRHTDEQRRSDFEMARYMAVDSARDAPVIPGAAYRDGTADIQILQDGELYGFRAENQTIWSRDLNELSKAMYFQYPTAELVDSAQVP